MKEKRKNEVCYILMVGILHYLEHCTVNGFACVCNESYVETLVIVVQLAMQGVEYT